MSETASNNIPEKLWRKLLLMKRISQDPRLPKRVKFIPGLIAAYLLSPIDLVPDFIPVLGYLDDLVVAGFLLWLFFRLVPGELTAHHRTILEAEPVKSFDLEVLTENQPAENLKTSDRFTL